MKKLILLSVIATSLMFGQNSSTTFKRKTETNDSIRVAGIVTKVRERMNYLKVYIALDNGKDIKARVSTSSRLRENDRVYGRCANYKNSEYRNCAIRRY
jgi:translation initiation factor IF-1